MRNIFLLLFNTVFLCGLKKGDMESANLLLLQNISKAYMGVKALDDVSIDFREGEIHALVGANGAGKSTLIKAISGAILPDAGRIVYNNVEYSSMTPQLSSSLGIEVIYQEFNLIPSLSVAENIFLGNRVNKNKLVNFKMMEAKADEILKVFDLNIDPAEMVKNISVAYMQIVEIAKALSHNMRLLVLDEPTAPLTTNEVDVLFRLARSLKEKGISIIYISHRLEEVFELSDRITVLRDGRKIITLNTGDTNRKELISYMINSELGDTYPKLTNRQEGEVLLEVKNLCGKGFKDISFKVHKGEIFGISGLVGAKRTEIVRAIFGADKLDSGEIIYEGKEIKIRSPHHAIAKGIALIPEDRKTQGVILTLSIGWNLTVTILKRLSRFFVINTAKEKKVIDQYKNVLKIKMVNENQQVAALSGGNQQKVVLSKWLASNSKLVIFDEPTRGIDVGAKQEIYMLINEMAEKGMGVILISSEIDEMIGLSDRMVILAEGEITGRLERDQFAKEHILDLESGYK
jgi:ribose transport system ATP-binding protein